MSNYADFLQSKRIVSMPSGFDVPEEIINPVLFPFQRAIVRWALRRGKAALFEDCGLGKTLQQLEWAEQVKIATGQNILILAPLAVAEQTIAEGEKFGYEVLLAENGNDITMPNAVIKRPEIYIANYDKLHKFSPESFGGIVLDESSILKGDGPTKTALVQFAKNIPYRLCASATPAPNDIIELSNHSEFLGVLSPKEVISLFFTQNGNSTKEWRLKGHAKQSFYEWLSSWAIAVRYPSDLGFDDDSFSLPEKHYFQHTVEIEAENNNLLAALIPELNEAKTLEDRRNARKESITARVKVAAEIVNASPENWVVWCDLNAESEALKNAISDAVEVTGAMSNADKKNALLRFTNGECRVIVSKPQIAGFGLNWQHCHNVLFVGLSDSYEQQYQAIRRCWRFGQQKPVNIHFVTSSREGAVLRNVKEKAIQMDRMFGELVDVMKNKTIEDLKGMTEKTETKYVESERISKEGGWRLLLGDCCERVKEIENDSIGLTVTSIPFVGMYTYDSSPRDIGNSPDESTLFSHMEFLIGELLRVTMPGRLCAIHVVNEPIFKGKEGYSGIRDSRGELVRRMTAAGWIFFGDVTINKDPQIKAARIKEQSLLFKTLSSDSIECRPAFPDYLCVFKKPGENPEPVKAGTHERWNPHGGWISSEEWIEWAHPVWNGIKESNVLNVRAARDPNDERHLCPLQLEIIERAIKLWSNPGDIVLDPFNGVGSTGYQAIKLRRKYVGVELKESYYDQAIKNLESAEDEMRQGSIFDLLLEDA